MNSFWKKGIAHWQVNKEIYVSIPFTWLVNDAISFIKQQKKKCIVGGPGAILMKDKFDRIAEIRESCFPFEPITYHNPFATFTTRGCVNKCGFCAVPKIEGDFREIKKFIPRPLVCDNNFLASSKVHFNRAVEKLKIFPYIDFNQGLEARLFTSERAYKLQELKSIRLRFSFDTLKEEKYVVDAINLAQKKGFNNISCYLLFGFKDTPKEALYKAKLLEKLKVHIYPMRFRPLNSSKRDEFVNTKKGWTDYELKRFKRYWGSLMKPNTFAGSFDEYDHRKDVDDLSLGLISSYREKRKGLW